MVDRGHCMMNYDYFDEYEKFYNYEEDEERIAKLNQEKYKDCKFGEEVEFVIGEKKEDSEDDWEDAEEWADEEDMMEDKKAADGEQTENKEKKVRPEKKERRTYKVRRAKVLDSGELLLPTGKILGTREFARYYKQRPRIHDESHVRMLENGRGVYKGKMTHELRMCVKENDGKSGALMHKQYQKHLLGLKMKADRMNKKHYDTKAKMWMKLGLTGNLTLIKHFRDQTMTFG